MTVTIRDDVDEYYDIELSALVQPTAERTDIHASFMNLYNTIEVLS